MNLNPTITTDAYKITHWLQRPENITKLYSYGEPRSGGKSKEILYFGMNYVLQEYFSKFITKADIEEGYEESLMTFGFDNYFSKDIWNKVLNLGYYPIKIKSVKEGTVLPESNVCFTIESTEPWFAGMTSHFEDYLMWLWYSTSVATRSFNIKKQLIPIFKETSDNWDSVIDFAVNDFGLRGAVFYEGAVVGGMAHLLSFRGSDNMPASKAVKDYYKTKGRALSVWATEHSVATSFGSGRGEFDYVLAQLNRAPDSAIISIVIDSYDADNFIKNVIGSDEIKSKIIARKGRTVFRPDSNIPINNVCKYSEMLGNIFGYSLNHKSYRVINNNVGLIQGDGMTETSIPELYRDYVKTGWSAENILTGSGGGLLVEGLTRDTQRWAIKASYAEKDGIPFNISKTPKSDMTKASKCGMLKLHKAGDRFSTIESSKETPPQFNGYVDALETVFENGEIKRTQTFDEIIKIAGSYLNK